MTYEADTDGTLLEIVAQEGDTLAVGELIARIGEPVEATDGAASRAGATRRSRRRGGARRGRREAEAEARRGAGRDRGRGAARRGASPRRPQRTADDGERVKASPSRGGWRASWASTSPACEGTGPGGRIVKADVEAAARATAARAAPPRSRTRRRRRRRPRRRAAAAEQPRRRSAGEGRPRRDDDAGAHAHAADRRAADGRVQGDRARLRRSTARSTWRRRVELRDAAQGRRRRTRPRRRSTTWSSRPAALALRELPRANGAYRDGKFELLLARERRRRGRRPGRARRADRLRRRPQVARRDRARGARARRARARRHDHAAGALGRHVHGLQPRHVRDRRASPRSSTRRRRRSSPSARWSRRPVVDDGEVVARATA